jgi:hypothetical protein
MVMGEIGEPSAEGLLPSCRRLVPLAGGSAGPRASRSRAISALKAAIYYSGTYS